MNERILKLLDEIAEAQKTKVFRTGEALVPNLTEDDILQPNDFPELENNPYFRYEEGVLEGIKTVQTALFSLFKENEM